jgi:hypothetical protein
MSMTRVRSLDTKKSGHFEKTLLQSIPNSFGHAYPKPCCRANRRASRVPRPCMHAGPFGRSLDAYGSFRAVSDRERWGGAGDLKNFKRKAALLITHRR